MKLLLIFVVTLLLTMGLTYAFAGPMLACPQPDGTVLYTNKDVKGCQEIVGPELSIVPSYPIHPNGGSLDHSRLLEASIPELKKVETPESEVVMKTCALYAEWVAINERTKGGFEYNDVEDTKKRLYLTKIFGSGFSPTMCKAN